MTHQEIQELLIRYREGKCTDVESVKIQEWYNHLNKDSRLTLTDDEKDRLENKLLNNIWENISETDVETISVGSSWWRSSAFYSGVAATIILALGYILFLNKPEGMGVAGKEPTLINASSGKMIEVGNQTGKDKRVVLVDKSIIVLSPGSKIIYMDQFSGGKREVQLIGDAFFEITKDPSNPFCVYSGNLVTRVLGTSFRIKSKTRDHVEVEVVTGKVSVFENKEVFAGKQSENAMKTNNGVILTPNQRATYFTESRHLITSLVEIPVIIDFSVNTENLVFSNTLLPDIIAGLQQEYGIEIVLANEGIAKCTFTGDLSDLPLYEKLDLICKSNAAAYEVKGTRILINGIGCDEK